MKTLLFKVASFCLILVFTAGAHANVFVCGNDQDLVVAIDQGVVIYAETNFDSFPNGITSDVTTLEGELGYSFFVDEFEGTQVFYRIYVVQDQIIKTEVLYQDTEIDFMILRPIPGATFLCQQL